MASLFQTYLERSNVLDSTKLIAIQKSHVPSMSFPVFLITQINKQFKIRSPAIYGINCTG